MRTSSTPISLILIVLLAPFASADEAILMKFKSEYPEASRKLQGFYSQLRMSGTETYEKVTKKWEFAGNGESLRSVVEEQDGAFTVIVANDKLSFDLQKSAGSSRYSVKSLGSAPPAQFVELERIVRRSTTPANATFAILFDSIISFLYEKNFHLIDARESDGPEGRIIELDWELISPDVPKRVGTFDFAADGSWVLRAYDFHFDHKDQKSGEVWRLGQHVIVDYEGRSGGIPLVKRVRSWGSGPGSKSPETVWEVTDLVPGPVPQSEFELAAFGISSDPVAEPMPVAYYLLALSALAAMMVLVFRYLQRRAEKSASPA